MATKNKSNIDSSEIEKFNLLAHKWWDSTSEFKPLHDINPLRLDYIKSKINLANKHVLDVGCGGGILTESLAKEGAIVTGIDQGDKVIKIAQIHALENNLNIDYKQLNIEDFLKKNKKKYDVITCLEMLEHVEDPQLVIDSAVRLLKPGGFLFLSTVNRTAKAYAAVIVAAEYVLSLLPRQTHSFERFIRPSELAAGVRKAGLDVLGVTGLDYSPFSRKAVLRAEHVDVNYLLVAQKPL